MYFLSRLALIIGIDNYINWNRLFCSINDAKYMKKILENCNFETRLLLNPTKAQLQDAILEFQFSLSAFDTGLLYFAGHGVEISGDQYLVPSDCPLLENSIYHSYMVDTTDLITNFSTSDNFVGIVILDCCRERMDMVTRARGASESSIFKAKGAFIAFATAPNETAHEADKDGHGIFTYYLGEVINEYGTEAIESIFKRVRVKVTAQHRNQIPWDYSSLLNEFYFKESQAVIKGVTETTSLNKLLSHLVIKDLAYSELIVEIENWLKQLPSEYIEMRLKKQDIILHILNQLDQYVLETLIQEEVK